MGPVAQRAGGVPLVICDAEVRQMLGSELVASFAAPPSILECGGEITLPVIEDLVARARSCESAGDNFLVFGIGGGKALDTAKGVARRLGADFVAVPTIASNDSPTGRAIAIYDDAHRLAAIEQIARSPEAVIVDTALIARAPARFLRGGIGDAIAKKFEAERACRDGGRNFFGTPPTLSALALADCCYRTLRAHAAQAMMDAGTGIPTPAFEATVEASLLMSGIAWESGGVSLAHALVRGIARMPGAEDFQHGEHVGYGLLVQLACESADDEVLVDMAAFHRSVGLPTRLSDMGIADCGSNTMERIAHWAHDGPAGSNLIVSASTDELVAAMRRIEAMTTPSA